MLRVLVVDDEKNIRTTLALALEGMGCAVGLAATAESALAQAGREAFDLALVDLKLAQGSGLDLIPRLIAENPGLDVVVITAYATIDTAVAIKAVKPKAKPAPEPCVARVERVSRQDHGRSERKSCTESRASQDHELRGGWASGRLVGGRAVSDQIG